MSRSSVCHFLWGPNTRSKDRIDVLQAFRRQSQITMQITLYRRTGDPFWCELTITPIKNERGRVVLFLCVYKPLLSPGSSPVHPIKLTHSACQLTNLCTQKTDVHLSNQQSSVSLNPATGMFNQFSRFTLSCQT
ncbi:hypothetical protein AHF37_04911 [Paragonimus kellicotti]|nr:hypothetical protein AHF37_04911 [Paragonimus kellicotti]